MFQMFWLGTGLDNLKQNVKLRHLCTISQYNKCTTVGDTILQAELIF